MRAFPVKQAGWLVLDFIPLEQLQPPATEQGGESTGGGDPLPPSAEDPGWPQWIAGIHEDGAGYWFELWGDAGQKGQSGMTKPYARYARQYPPPQPPDPPPSKADRDGTTLYIPNDDQLQGSCTFHPVPYD